MAIDNFSRFNSFTNVNPNIAELGYTAEEHRLAQGAPDGNPIHSPMAAPGVSETQLALKPAGSDRLRLGDPQQPVINPYEGPKRTLFLSRNAVAKLRGRVLQDLQNLVDQGAVGSPEVRQRMEELKPVPVIDWTFPAILKRLFPEASGPRPMKKSN